MVGKIFLLAWTIAIMGQSIKDATHQSFWLAYLTHWGAIWTSAYFVMSVVSALYLARRPPAKKGVLEGGVGVMAKATWILFAVSLPTEICIAILYWTLQFDGSIYYTSGMLHAGFVGLLLIDGFVLSRIPLRMKQLIPNLIFCLMYIIWSLIHAYSGIGNPYKDDGTQNDDGIYTSIAWKNDPARTGIICGGVLFIGYPVVFTCCRMLSRLPPRRYCEDEDHKFEGGENGDIVEDTTPESFNNDEEAPQAVVF